MTTACTWASCRRLATHRGDGWLMCSEHYREHLDLKGYEAAAPVIAADRLARADARLRRCWWCGGWAYALNDCNDCAAPAERPAYMDERKTG